MDSIFFHIKLAHYRALAFARQKLAPFDITPARFDLLIAIKQHECGAFQTDLVAALGTVKSNISRLCRVLHELGYITLGFDGSERREGNLWSITQRGEDLIARVFAATQEKVSEMSEKCAHAPPPEENEAPKQSLARVIRAVRTAFGDRCLFDAYDPNLEKRLEETLIFVPRKKPPADVDYTHLPKQNVFNGYFRRNR